MGAGAWVPVEREAGRGDLETLQWAREHNCPWDESPLQLPLSKVGRCRLTPG